MADPSSTPSQTEPSRGHAEKEEMKADAKRLKQTAAKQGEAKAKEEKDAVGRVATSTSSAMQTAAEQLRDDSAAPDWFAVVLSGVAREMDRLASRLHDKSPRELAGETRRFAKDNPAGFLAASAATGFAGTRSLCAGTEYHDDIDIGSDSGGNDVTVRSTMTPAVESASGGVVDKFLPL